MPETQGTAKLVAKDEMLCVQFDPPLDNASNFHDPKAGHPIQQVVKHSGSVRWLIYDRGVFGWRDAEREDAFIDYCQEQAGKIGYEVVNGLLHTSAQVPVVEEV